MSQGHITRRYHCVWCAEKHYPRFSYRTFWLQDCPCKPAFDQNLVGAQRAILPSGPSVQSRVLAIAPNLVGRKMKSRSLSHALPKLGSRCWARTNDLVINSHSLIPTELSGNKLARVCRVIFLLTRCQTPYRKGLTMIL